MERNTVSPLLAPVAKGERTVLAPLILHFNHWLNDMTDTYYKFHFLA